MQNLTSPEQLVREIVAVNHAWKMAAACYGADTPLAISSRELKSRLQVRLLREYSGVVYLELDSEVEPGVEPLYGLKLRQPLSGYRDAAHIPCRVARELLSEEEIEKHLMKTV